MSTDQINEIFTCQVNRLIELQYPKLTNMTEKQFTDLLEPLREKVQHTSLERVRDEKIPFIIVITSKMVSMEKAMEQIDHKGQKGHVNMFPTNPESFSPIEGLVVPDALAYVITDIDTGKADTLNVTPFNALISIREKGRSPLTIDEGVAVLTQYPDILKTRNCFSLVGSRQAGQRVPALWISYKRPRLGWCWENNPHTWLGSASCAARLG
jgi:hypothetical protein